MHSACGVSVSLSVSFLSEIFFAAIEVTLEMPVETQSFA
jgi:hypothetical protein